MDHRRACACNEKYTLFINTDGKVISFGNSKLDVKGDVKRGEIVYPKIIPSLECIISVSVGENHCACLDNNGDVFTFGSLGGEIGPGVDNNELLFTSIPQQVNLPPCIQVCCGTNFTICLCENGTVYSFGYNKCVLGIGNTYGISSYEKIMYNSPQQVKSLNNVEFIDCGAEHVFCKTLNNEIYCWGYNDLGQLGLGNTNNQNAPILCSPLSNEDVIDIQCSKYNTLVLTSNGDVLSCGFTTFAALGNVDMSWLYFQKIEDLPEITKIACGGYHFTCIDINNDFYVFGNNSDGQLGLGDTEDRYEPIKHPSLSNIIDISLGEKQTFVKTPNNEIYAFGKNYYSQLGIKTEDNKQLSPIRVFEDNEDIWCSINKPAKAKSARSIKNKHRR